MGKLISLIYFYLVSIIGIILLIIGLYNAVSFAVNSTLYDKYPLRYAGNEDCSYITRDFTSQPKPLPADPSMASPSADQVEEQKAACERRVEAERKQHQVDDIKNGIYFTLIGIILLALHFPVALKKSAEK
jgi:hypothetical protein